MHITGLSSQIILNNIQFKSNNARYNGGGVYVSKILDIKIINGHFSFNKANEKGSGLYFKNL